MKTIPIKQAIFFDLDGTLIDSVPDLATAVNIMLEKLGRKIYSETTIRNWVGNGSVTIVKRALLNQYDVDNESINGALLEEAHALFLEAYETHLCNTTKPYPHVLETLKELKNSGYRLAIITNKPHRFVGTILQCLHMDNLFSFFFGGDTLPKKKPDPLPLLQMCELMNLPKEACVMVGDSGNDMRAANAANIDAVGVTYGYNHDEDLQQYTPAAVIDNFTELLKIF
ncbi:MAG: phosphoglycolate phosphatase [Sulfurovum sp.]|nr:phosphoglycolate phosphatase [Sulfurovum sp.]MCB4745511.1 phosphoglycolate phosphatase [Sulfurovum sp.]MCB4745593.1 phosphoglycolate phosphatase [Sulfurovum sp.]MCB4748092.1 phosphoglycolate phosphatase [Sulfurovum sp.]MCB4749046.1 phosphoglycolate phosphatase [Sulfurovum sp.]